MLSDTCMCLISHKPERLSFIHNQTYQVVKISVWHHSITQICFPLHPQQPTLMISLIISMLVAQYLIYLLPPLLQFGQVLIICLWRLNPALFDWSWESQKAFMKGYNYDPSIESQMLALCHWLEHNSAICLIVS